LAEIQGVRSRQMRYGWPRFWVCSERTSRDIEFAWFILCERYAQKWGAVMTVYGYARVSTDGQTLATQDAALRAAGCAKIFSEKASGAKSDRAELRKAVSRLGEGDVLMVTRFDRLARGTRDLRRERHTWQNTSSQSVCAVALRCHSSAHRQQASSSEMQSLFYGGCACNRAAVCSSDLAFETKIKLSGW
jgi:hypothetical protein